MFDPYIVDIECPLTYNSAQVSVKDHHGPLVLSVFKLYLFQNVFNELLVLVSNKKNALFCFREESIK